VLTLDRLKSLLTAFPRLSVGLVGDLFLDRYLDILPGEPELSIETGLEAYQVFRVRNSPGALGTVMNNLTALGLGRLVPVAVIGDDGHGYDLLAAISSLSVDPAHIIRDPNRLTPTYTKPMKPVAGHPHAWAELNRLDVRTREPLSPAMQSQLEKRLSDAFDTVDGWIVLDQIHEGGAGVVNPATRRILAELARQKPEKLIFIDSRAAIGEFSFGILKPNRIECLAAVHGRAAGLTPAVHSVSNPSGNDVAAAALELTRRTGRAVFCTLGEQGILVAHPEGVTQLAAAVPVSGPIDIVGAGDAATAAIVASLLAGATELEAAQIANLAASITIQQLGTTGTASPEQIVARWRDGGGSQSDG
jgi:bifunctional ADP-heptose synthase (sugar kinase/adenylyltransferase)